MTRVVIISDLHCGHRAGICCPGWQTPESAPGVLGTFAKQQRAMWAWYSATMASLQPIDILIVNGDAIDGRGGKNKGVELITSDLEAQCQIAAGCIKEAKARKEIHVAIGTQYHTSPEGEKWEKIMADMVGATSCKNHLFLDIEGVIFDIRHHVGGSGIPHGRSTAVKKADLWNLVWHDRYNMPRCDVLIRSHVHYFDYNGNRRSLGLTTPAMCGWGSDYGELRCDGTVDIGLIQFDVEFGRYSWQGHFFDPKVDVLQRCK